MVSIPLSITLAAIGRIKAGPEKALFEHYAARLPWKIAVKECDVKQEMETQRRQQEEGRLLIAAMQQIEHVLVLDESGQDIDSTTLAAKIKQWCDRGMRQMGVVIGGADGLHAQVRERASLVLAFGKVTWPHTLMRGLVAEQLYRAYTIAHHHPYHRG